MIWSTLVNFEADNAEKAEQVRQEINDLLWDKLDRPATVSPVAQVAPMVVFDQESPDG